MGKFSWYRADNNTKQLNFVEGNLIKVLIPKEFGGGFIKGHYGGYGDVIVDETTSYDVYELLAIWNSDQVTDEIKKKNPHIWNWLVEIENSNKVPTESKRIDNNRLIGIALGCFDWEMQELKYPLKLVSTKYKGTYEDLNTFSKTDPDQGFFKKYNRK